MVGFLLQWPTLVTLAMFPVLLYVYRRLAIREERDVATGFGPAWDSYAERTPRFVPRRGASASVGATDAPPSQVAPARAVAARDRRRP